MNRTRQSKLIIGFLMANLNLMGKQSPKVIKSKNITKAVIAALILTLSISACSKKNGDKPRTKTTVYVLGENRGGQSVIWKNGIPSSHPKGMNAYAMTVEGEGEGEDIYLTGKISKFPFGYDVTAAYWKNGTIVELTDGKNIAKGLRIAVSGTDVHVVGIETDYKTGLHTAKYWKNKELVADLTDGTNTFNIKHIEAVGPDVYIAGTESINSKNVGKYWKNGKLEKTIEGAKNILIQGISIRNNNVYLVGDEYVNPGYKIKYWKNGEEEFSLPENLYTVLAGMVFIKNDVYLAINNSEPKNTVIEIWKNGKFQHNLNDGSTDHKAKSIATDGKDLYVLAEETTTDDHQVVKYFKNKEEVILSESKNNEYYSKVFNIALGTK